MNSQGLPSTSRFERLLGFWESDRGNVRLLADAAAAALDEGRGEEALVLLERGEAEGQAPPELLNLKGLAALASRRADAARDAFAALAAAGLGGPAVRFNLAAAEAGLGDHEAVLALLDEETVAAVDGGPLLRIRALHHLGRVDQALEEGAVHAEARPGDGALMGALAQIALDAEQPELARAYAERAGSDPEGLAAAGTLRLDEGRADEALDLFRRAAAAAPHSARAALGLGSALLAGGDAAAAVEPLERAAEGFGDHPGSWIAAGWARYLRGDRAEARERFERALACDDNFAESHGALAVVDIAEGHVDEGRKRLEIATRLDRQCFSAALARTLLLEREGHQAAADKVRAAALAAPVDAAGRTLAEALAALGRH